MRGDDNRVLHHIYDGSASAFCNGEPAISQPLLDAASDAGQACRGNCKSNKPAAHGWTECRILQCSKTIKAAPANGQWHSGRLLCNGAAGMQASEPGFCAPQKTTREE